MFKIIRRDWFRFINILFLIWSIPSTIIIYKILACPDEEKEPLSEVFLLFSVLSIITIFFNLITPKRNARLYYILICHSLFFLVAYQLATCVVFYYRGMQTIDIVSIMYLIKTLIYIIFYITNFLYAFKLINRNI